MSASSIGSEHPDGVIRVEPATDRITAVCLDGNFDLVNAPELRHRIDSALEGGNDLIIDLTRAAFIDSSVIHILFHSANAVEGRDQTVVLQLATAPIVERALELVRIEDVLPLAHSRAEAIELIVTGS